MITLLVKPDEEGVGAEFCAVSDVGQVWKGHCHTYPVPTREEGNALIMNVNHRRMVMKRAMNDGHVLVSEEIANEADMWTFIMVIGYSGTGGLSPSRVESMRTEWNQRYADARGQHRAFPMPLAVKDLDHSLVIW